ncbi:MAG: TonB-dependent receptor plug domain-containing protein [Gemmatimonadaceae bacterium]|nr:TonB-dependent receptor plug domain-containing protein [Gemmatimonadaceae bacterium]
MWRPVAVAACWWGVAVVLACSRTPASGHPSPRAAPAAESTRAASNTTGAVDSLSGEALRARHADDIAQMLQGRVAGLQVIRLPNGNLSLRIRGGDPALNSNADVAAEPLLVIDGMPVAEGRLSDALEGLNPSEIVSIRVLKDVSSTSIYGIRGAHGVILIELKRD